MRKVIFILLALYLTVLTGCSASTDKSVNGNDYKNTAAASTKTVENSSAMPLETKVSEETNKLPPKDKLIPVTLYCQDSGGYLIPVTVKIAKCTGIAKAVLNTLVDSPANYELLKSFGLSPVLPEDTVIQGINIKNGTAVVDFNKKFLETKSAAQEKNIISSIVYTLTEFKTIQNVKLLVNGYLCGKLKSGTDASGLLGRDNILVNAGSLKPENGKTKYDAYLYRNISENRYCLVPISREIKSNSMNDIVAGIFDFITKKLDETGLFTMLPVETKLLASSLKDNVLTINLSKDIKKYGGGTAREQGILDQILFSMKQIKGVTKVKILIDGKEDTLPEGTELKKELSVPDYINEFDL
ncbi:MAG: GerMN domain-containing protein [Bacillota bacterium]|nr:GerMN domain-containing protein [Bacillota bacterium]